MPSFEASNGPMPALPMPASSPSPFRAPLVRKAGPVPIRAVPRPMAQIPHCRLLATGVDEREKLVPMEFVGAARTLRLAVPSRIHLFAYSRLGALVFNGLRACGTFPRGSTSGSGARIYGKALPKALSIERRLRPKLQSRGPYLDV